MNTRLETHDVLQRPDFRWEGLVQSRARSEKWEKILVDDVDTRFAEYPLHDAPDFFEVYPIKLSPERRERLAEQIPNRLAPLSSVDILKAFETYRARLSSQSIEAIGKLHYATALRNSAGAKEPTAPDMLDAASRTKAAGLPMTEIPSMKVGLIEILGGSTIKDGALDFPVGFDSDLPAEATRLNLDEAFSGPLARTADVLILVNVSAAKATREIRSNTRVSSEYKTGERSEPNPAYSQAQTAVNVATIDLQRVQINNATTRSTGSFIADLIVLAANAAAEGVARDRLQAASSQLASTPSFLTKPVYSPYSFRKAEIDVIKEGVVDYYVVDRRSKTVFDGSFTRRQTQSFKVAYELKELDPRELQHLSEMVREDVVTKFEDSPLTLKLSDVHSGVRASLRAKPLAALDAVKADMMAKRSRLVAQRQSATYVAKPVNDDRFDSVVVVKHPGGGIGSGFFVRDDIVLTNYHVIEGAQIVEMKLKDGQETFGRVSATDIRLDLALIRVQARGKPVRFFTQNTLPIGNTVEAIGHPRGLEFSLTRGVVSGMRELESTYARGGKKVRFIQTDTAINPGNSGGPLFLGTHVIGVSTQKLAATDLEGLGFAIHYSELLEFLARNQVTAALTN